MDLSINSSTPKAQPGSSAPYLMIPSDATTRNVPLDSA
jgi:hypothetical protein